MQQAEFVAGQAQQLAAVADLELVGIDLERRSRRLDHHPRRHALEDGLDPCGDLARAEGLDHIIVGADFQAHHPVDFTVPGTEEHHRHLAEAPQLLAGFEAADVRQADVENQQVRRRMALIVQRRLPEIQPGGAEPFTLQGKNQRIGNRRFVFDNQDMRHGIQAREVSARTVPDASCAVNQV